ncbi:hypothetical protein [Oryzibacter oryziterrae]|uniref:hypothetical protein n=1 Tax=Oryzibacter oryziterrae TaxID=2766474 RepID=UPI001F2E629A|nr:hypothetical protein [Oryzibacter oryziterrae]
MELPLAGVIGALFGVGIGVLDFGVIASLIRKGIEKTPGRLTPRQSDLLMRGLFVVNALVFGGLGWWLGVSVAGTGLPGHG